MPSPAAASAARASVRLRSVISGTGTVSPTVDVELAGVGLSVPVELLAGVGLSEVGGEFTVDVGVNGETTRP